MRADHCWRHVESVARHLAAVRGPRNPFALPGTEPAYPPDRPVVPVHLHLWVKVDPQAETVEGHATHLVTAVGVPATQIRFDAQDLEIEDVTIQGRPEPAKIAYDGRVLDVTLWEPLPVGEHCALVIRYKVSKPRLGLYFIKPSVAEPDRPVQVWSQNQDDDARYWFPCMDHPGLKMTTSLSATVPEGFRALSNGVPSQEEPEKYYQPGWLTWHWRMDAPHPVYLVTLVVGRFAEGHDAWDGIPVSWYCHPGREPEAQRAFGKTAAMMQFFSEYLRVRYAWPRYGQVAVSEFVFGGMENTTLTTQTDRCLHDERAALDYSADSLVAHELAHQWFGDLVTCRDWSHGWLNEGFATYFEALFVEHDKGKDEFDEELFELAEDYFKEDRERYRRPVVSREWQEPIDVFDRHLYHKGAWVLHMLRARLGDGPFRAGLRTYLERFQFNQAETSDLRRALEDTTGRSLSRFFDEWLYRGGFPELTLSSEVDSATGTVTLSLAQGDGEPYELEAPVLVRWGVLERRQRIRMTRKSQSLMLSPPEGFAGEPVTLVCFDPDATLLAATTLDHAMGLLTRQLTDGPSILRRIDAARALAKKGGRTATVALVKALTTDLFWGVRKQIALALGGLGGSEAEAALIAALGTEPHAKARRGIVQALAGFRTSEAVRTAVHAHATAGDASYAVEGELLTAVGKLGAEGAQTLLESGLSRPSFSEVIRAGALQGLAALRTEAALALVEGRTAIDHPTLVRISAIAAMAQLGAEVPTLRSRVVDHLKRLAHEREFRLQMALVSAWEQLGSPDASGGIATIEQRAADGRVTRRAREAQLALDKSLDAQAPVARLRDDLERLKRDYEKLRDRVERSGT